MDGFLNLPVNEGTFVMTNNGGPNLGVRHHLEVMSHAHLHSQIKRVVIETTGVCDVTMLHGVTHYDVTIP